MVGGGGVCPRCPRLISAALRPAAARPAAVRPARLSLAGSRSDLRRGCMVSRSAAQALPYRLRLSERAAVCVCVVCLCCVAVRSVVCLRVWVVVVLCCPFAGFWGAVVGVVLLSANNTFTTISPFPRVVPAVSAGAVQVSGAVRLCLDRWRLRLLPCALWWLSLPCAWRCGPGGCLCPAPAVCARPGRLSRLSVNLCAASGLQGARVCLRLLLRR